MTLIKESIFFGENDNCNQTGKGYIEFDISLRKIGGEFNNIVVAIVDEAFILVNKGSAYGFSFATLSTKGGKKIVGINILDTFKQL